MKPQDSSKLASVADYGWQSTAAPESCNYIAPRILEELKTLTISRVLDIGSGNGALCGHLNAAGYQAVGMEYDRRGVELARDSYSDITFYDGGVEDEPELLLRREAPFDAVVSTEVIEHLFAPHLLPRFAHAVLNTGGYFLLTTPFHGYWKNLALSLFNGWDRHHAPLWHGGHIKFWSRATLTRLLTENQFEVVKFSGVGRVPYLWKSMVIVARKA